MYNRLKKIVHISKYFYNKVSTIQYFYIFESDNCPKAKASKQNINYVPKMFLCINCFLNKKIISY